jgi:hypothetical protein
MKVELTKMKVGLVSALNRQDRSCRKPRLREVGSIFHLVVVDPPSVSYNADRALLIEWYGGVSSSPFPGDPKSKRFLFCSPCFSQKV